MQACNDGAVQTGTEIREFGNRQTTVSVVGYNIVGGCKFVRISYITILKIRPVVFVGSDGPIESGVEFAIDSTFTFEELIEPGRSRDVGPTAIVTGTKVALNSRSLCGIGTCIYRSPLVVGALRSIVKICLLYTSPSPRDTR